MTEHELSSTAEAAVREEAERILGHPAFRQSERCSRFLRYLVDVSLRHPAIPVKERTIGHDVFGRPPGYDTSADPVVRNVASEARRRLRQYEHDGNPSRPICIGLPAGQYMLTFSFRAAEEVPEEPVRAEPVANATSAGTEERMVARFPALAWCICILLAALLPAAAWLGYRTGHKRHQAPTLPAPPRNYFWDAFLDGKTRVIISVSLPRVKESALGVMPSPREWASTIAYGNLTGMIVSRHQPYRMRLHERTTVDDMRDTPTVIAASLDSPMVSQLLAPLRFYTGVDREHEEIWIVDRSNPNARWAAPLSWPTVSNQVGYAIIARLKNSVTGGDIIIASGQSPLGTLVASDVITNPRFVQMLNQTFRRPDANVEIVLKLHSIQGSGVSPELVSAYSW